MARLAGVGCGNGNGATSVALFLCAEMVCSDGLPTCRLRAIGPLSAAPENIFFYDARTYARGGRMPRERAARSLRSVTFENVGSRKLLGGSDLERRFSVTLGSCRAW